MSVCVKARVYIALGPFRVVSATDSCLSSG